MFKGDGGKVVTVACWIARIASGLAAGLILLIFLGEGIAGGFETLLHLSIRETAMMIAFFAVWLGLVLGWRWELAGGLLTVCGMIAFYLLDYAFSGTFPRGPFFLLIAFPSLLFIYCGLETRRSRKPEQRENHDRGMAV